MSEIEDQGKMWRFKGIAFSKDIYPDKESVLVFAKAKGWIIDEPKKIINTEISARDMATILGQVAVEKPKKKRWSGLRKKPKKRKKENASSS